MKIIIALTFSLALAAGLIVGMDRQDRADCLTWQSQAKQLDGFFLTQDQADQCAHWHIEVDAPVK